MDDLIIPTLTAAEVAAECAGQPTATIVGFGSLLSETSARGTCPGLSNFQIARVRGWQRVFAHPAAIFFERGIARPETKEIASLSAELGAPEASFVVATFEVPTEDIGPLLLREEEFDFVKVPFYGLGAGPAAPPLGHGYMCTRSTDDEVLDTQGLREKYRKHLEPAFGFTSIWGEQWGEASGIRPCPVYCRHCVLATRRDGVPDEARESFLDNTLLADRKTTLREYLAGAGSHVMDSLPPPSLSDRYNG